MLATLRPKKLNKRGRGPVHPAEVGPALSKSPARNLREEVNYIENGDEEEDVPVLDRENQGAVEIIEELEFDGDHEIIEENIDIETAKIVIEILVEKIILCDMAKRMT